MNTMLQDVNIVLKYYFILNEIILRRGDNIKMYIEEMNMEMGN